MWARLENNTVQEVISFDPTGKFHPSLTWILCGGDVRHGWSYENGVFSPPVSHELDAETIKEQKERLLENHIVSVAKADGWRSQESCMAAAGYDNPWQAKAQAFVAWWALCWQTAHKIFDDVVAGRRAVPTDDELISAMPKMVWPK